jgi:hypothetical protein
MALAATRPSVCSLKVVSSGGVLSTISIPARVRTAQGRLTILLAQIAVWPRALDNHGRAECKDRLAKNSRVIGYTIGRFGRVAEITTHSVVTDEEIRKARDTELDIAEAFRIVLNMAKRNIIKGHGLTGERVRQTAACGIVEDFVVRLR